MKDKLLKLIDIQEEFHFQKEFYGDGKGDELIEEFMIETVECLRKIIYG